MIPYTNYPYQNNQTTNYPYQTQPTSLNAPGNMYNPYPQNITGQNNIYNNPVNTNQSFISGRIVENQSEIKPNEIPMDGSLSFFPTKDCSCIYVKVWGNDGQLRTFRFVPEKQDGMEPQSEFSQVLSRLDSIEKKLSIMNVNNKPYKKTTYYNKELVNNKNNKPQTEVKDYNNQSNN